MSKKKNEEKELAPLLRNISAQQMAEFLDDKSAPTPTIVTIAVHHPHAIFYHVLAIWNACQKYHRRLCLVAKDEFTATIQTRSLRRAGVCCNYLPLLTQESRGDNDKIKAIDTHATERIRAWYGYHTSEEETLLLCSVASFTMPIIAPTALYKNIVIFAQNTSFSRTIYTERLSHMGYRRVATPSAVGEYAIRGEVIDIFALGEPHVLRIRTEFDAVVSIEALPDVHLHDNSEHKSHAPERTKGNTKREERTKLVVMPLRECPDSEQLTAEKCTTPQRALNTKDVCCMFYYTHTVDERTVYQSTQEIFKNTVYKNIQFSPLQESNARNTIKFCPKQKINSATSPSIQSDLRPSPKYYNNLQLAESECTRYHKSGYTLYAMNDLKSYLPTEPALSALLKPISVSLPYGIFCPNTKAIFFSASDFFVSAEKHKIDEVGVHEAFVDRIIKPALAQLKIGDYVTHARHGIGKYLGLEQMTVNNHTRDYFIVQYADDVKVFIPPEQLHLLQRYRTFANHEPRLDQIGCSIWHRRRASAQKHTDRHAVQLLRMYMHRNAERGIAFADDDAWQQTLQKSFPFTETKAQIRCLEEIFSDMKRERPMNRLLCGDSGNGKTEIALRAAVKCAYSAYQTILLAPTTVLAEQHYETFTHRLATLPITVALFTRMTSDTELAHLKSGFATGAIDIIIATHRLLYEQEIAPATLGLLIIDEEHRFGVRAKEKIKALNAKIDYLAISATPIPRSLQFALSHLHDISFLDEAPRNRKPVITKLYAYDVSRIVEAVRLEITRGGQIFYLYNKISLLQQKKMELNALFPELRIAILHGQMKSEHIDDKLHAFIHRKYDILLSTTIIENGIDIPNANTIIVEAADNFGITNLYQLRGRVGRSDTQAYAYLLYNPVRYKKAQVQKRLNIINDPIHYNSGLSIASEDLEMRGAGNILGQEQSGHITSVGYEMYIKMLDNSIRALTHTGTERHIETYLKLEYEGYLPDDYIPSIQEKLIIYQQVALANSNQDIVRLQRGMVRSYGELPQAVETLLSVATLRLLAQQLWFTQIRQIDATRFRIHADKIARLNQNHLLELIEKKQLILMPAQKENIMISVLSQEEYSVYYALCALLRDLCPA